jgi:hypothetical protein
MAHWHSLAKLRMHTELSLDVLDAVTISLGQKLRDFNQTTCSAFETRELRREAEARSRRAAKGRVASTQSKKRDTFVVQRRIKTLNLNTYKGHALGDYADTIRRYGTTDSYSTAPVCVILLFVLPTTESPRESSSIAPQKPDTVVQAAKIL